MRGIFSSPAEVTEISEEYELHINPYPANVENMVSS